MRRSRPADVTYYEWSVIRWLSSDTRAKLDPAGRGIYRELLDLCYATGSIPKEFELMARKADCTEEQLRRVWPIISRHFRTDKKHPGTLTNRFADTFRTHYFHYVYQQKQRGVHGGRKKVPLKPNGHNEMLSDGLSARLSLTTTDTTTTNTDTTTTDANRQQQLLTESEWPLASEAVCREYPTTDSAMMLSIVHAAGEAAVSAGVNLTDAILAEALQTARAQTPKQNGPALYRKTVPAVIRNWASEAKRGKRG